ncbi:MAG: hypothetical protein ACYDA2_05565 [Acidimicrobiales bacterium]
MTLAAALGAGAGALLGLAPASAAPATPIGYWFIAGNGALWSIGGAQYASQTVSGTTGPLSSPLSAGPVAPIVGIAATTDGKGYWAADAIGGVYAYGDAKYLGSIPGLNEKPNAPIVGIAANPTGGGYWLVGADGGVYGFGTSGFLGSLPGLHIPVNNVVGMSPTADGGGYVLADALGGVYSFGDAPFAGSYYSKTGAASPTPIVGVSVSPNGGGYVLARQDGAVYAFGGSFFGGSPLLSGVTGAPIIAIAYTPDGGGYWVVAADGGVFCYGDAPYIGSIPSELLNTGVTNSTPMVGFAPTL